MKKKAPALWKIDVVVERVIALVGTDVVAQVMLKGEKALENEAAISMRLLHSSEYRCAQAGRKREIHQIT